VSEPDRRDPAVQAQAAVDAARQARSHFTVGGDSQGYGLVQLATAIEHLGLAVGFLSQRQVQQTPTVEP